MSDLVNFLLRRIAEDEAGARAATGREWKANDRTEHYSDGSFGSAWEVLSDRMDKGWAIPVVETPLDRDYQFPMPGCERKEDATHIAHWDPARVLAECEAKRRIVEGMQPYGEIDDLAALEVLRLLAAVYADHPEYREEWRP